MVPQEKRMGTATVSLSLPVPALTAPLTFTAVLSFSVRSPLPVEKAPRLAITLFWPIVALAGEPPASVPAVMMVPDCCVTAPPAVRLTVPLPAYELRALLGVRRVRFRTLPLLVENAPVLVMVLL